MRKRYSPNELHFSRALVVAVLSGWNLNKKAALAHQLKMAIRGSQHVAGKTNTRADLLLFWPLVKKL